MFILDSMDPVLNPIMLYVAQAKTYSIIQKETSHIDDEEIRRNVFQDDHQGLTT